MHMYSIYIIVIKQNTAITKDTSKSTITLVNFNLDEKIYTYKESIDFV
jgi:hypothetical protein